MTSITTVTRRTKIPRQNPQRKQKAKQPQANRRTRRSARSVVQTSRTSSMPSEKQLIRRLNRNQNAFITDVSQYAPRMPSERSMFMGYMKTLVNNEKTECRYPDSEPRPTALFTSVSTFVVPMTPDGGTSNTYRFSAAIQPIMGDTSDVTHYQAAVVNDLSTLGQNYDTADFSNPASYTGSIGGRDPRVDINYQYLASSAGSGTAVKSVFTPTGAALAQPSIAVYPPPTQNYVGSALPNNVTTVNTQLGTLRLIQNADGSLTFPAGSFSLILRSRVTAGAAPLVQVVPLAVWDPTAGIITQAAGASLNSADIAAGATGTVTAEYSIIVQRPAKIYFNITKNALTTMNPIAAADLAAMTNTVTATTTQFAQPGPNTGAIQLIRPVAQTVLVTYMGPELTDGGRVVSHFLPRTALASNYFTSSPANSQGQYQKCESLATVKNAYDGKLHDGTFIWWAPFDKSDSEFQSISSMNSNTWPCIVVSGLFNPAGSTIGSSVSLSNIVRIRVCTTFEFMTESTAFDDQISSGSSRILDSVQNALAGQPHAMPNGLHLDWIGNVLKSAGSWAVNHPDTVLKGLATAATLL